MQVVDNGGKMLPVSETLFIPLFARASETSKPNPIVSDKKSVDIISKVDATNKIVSGGEISTVGILARTIVIDNEVEKILSIKPNATIINLGAGLDTRICRADNGVLKWYDLDLPEVIALRRRFFSENERIHYIAKSVLDPSWINEIDIFERNCVTIIAEGLFMYFSENEVRQIFNILSEHFIGAHMFFDVVHSFFIGKKISSTFLWGIEHAKDVEKLHPKAKLVQAWSMGDLLKERQSPFFRMMNFLPSTRNRSQILHIEFTV